MKPFLIIFALIAVLLAGSYGYFVNQKEALDDTARKSATGQFIKLSDGVVHYEIAGPATGQVVVLIHGVTTPCFVWDHNFQELVNAGFRVLRYDHYGRGFSDRPDGVYDRDLYDRELVQLLQGLKIRLPVYLTGLSMGGAVAVNFADRHPEMVSKMALFAPAGFPIKESFPARLARIPLIGDYIMAIAGDRIVLSAIGNSFVHPEKLPEFEEKFKVQMQYRGYKRALLSTLRHMHMNQLGPVYERVGRQKKPVLLVWGTKDAVLPFHNSEKVKAAMPHLLFHAIDGGGHNSNYENAVIANSILLKFFQDP